MISWQKRTLKKVKIQKEEEKLSRITDAFPYEICESRVNTACSIGHFRLNNVVYLILRSFIPQLSQILFLSFNFAISV